MCALQCACAFQCKDGNEVGSRIFNRCGVLYVLSVIRALLSVVR